MNYAKLLAAGVGSWIQFEHACARSNLFSEKYLTHPVGQILSARSGNRTYAEFKHPVLAELSKGSGRRPEVDFAVCDASGKVSIAVESKWIGRSRPTVSSVLWDLMRLELLAHHEQARCFFLLGGKRSELDKFFMRKTFSAGSSSYRGKPLLRHDSNQTHRTELVPTHTNLTRIPILRKLFADYLDVEFPHEFVTVRTAPFPLEQVGRGFQIYVWEVKSAKRRDTFLPRNSKHYRPGYKEEK